MGAAIPNHTNPAEFLLDLTSSDFAQGNDDAQERILKLQVNWQGSPEAVDIAVAASTTVTEKDRPGSLLELSTSRSTFIAVVIALLYRSFIKSYRDVVVYGIRLAMYIGMSAPQIQKQKADSFRSCNPDGNRMASLAPESNIHRTFYQCHRTSLPAPITWARLKRRHNSPTHSSSAPPSCPSWPSPTSLLSSKTAQLSSKSGPMASTAPQHSCSPTSSLAYPIYVRTCPLIITELLCLQTTVLISVVFSLITYFLTNFRPDASAFYTYLMWLFLDLLAGESLVIFMSSLFPNFVVALALIAFANGLWMSVGGFLVSPKILNPFWRYVFHYIDYVSLHSHLSNHQPHSSAAFFRKALPATQPPTLTLYSQISKPTSSKAWWSTNLPLAPTPAALLPAPACTRPPWPINAL